MADGAQVEDGSFSLLLELEQILDSDPLIDEIGFIHPTQLAALSGEAGVDPSSAPEGMRFFSRDHKLGVSTQVLFPLYNQAKKAFFDQFKRYRMHRSTDGAAGDESSIRRCVPALDELGIGVMKHSRALLLLSADFGTAWNSRREIALKKNIMSMYMDELRFSELILSHSAKSEQAWSYRRWIIKRIAGEVPNLEEIVGKESELVERIAERSKMNYRAWNHRCWLVSYMTVEQVLYELKKSKVWAGLHVADSSCFHYRRRLMMKILAHFCCKNTLALGGSSNEIYETWKEELSWNESLIKRYIGREALWLYRRFLSLHWLRDFETDADLVSCNSKHTTMSNDGPGSFLDNELRLCNSCSAIPDSDFDDFQAQAMYSTTYILWLAKQLPRSQTIQLRKKINTGDMKTLLKKLCPQRSFICDMPEE